MRHLSRRRLDCNGEQEQKLRGGRRGGGKRNPPFCFILDNVRIHSGILLSDPDISFLIVPCLDKHHTADKAEHVDDREPEEGRE